MVRLLGSTVIWGFSFGLIKRYLVGFDAAWVAQARLLLALLVLLPFLRLRTLTPGLAVRLLGLGALQYGVMYVTYIRAFHYLAAYQVALFTIFTPLYVVLLDELKNRRLVWRPLLAAVLAVVGCGIIVFQGPGPEKSLTGFLLVQVSNLCFAFGQLAYGRLKKRFSFSSDRRVFALLYAGGFGIATAWQMACRGLDWPLLGFSQLLVVVYLGVIGSGLGFYLWNTGATRVGAGILAVFNNLKVPLAVLVSLAVFGETTRPLPFLFGGAALAAALGLAWPRRGKNVRTDPGTG